ncbi:Ku protein [Roseiarcus sp.]|uniref:non-homologous end joining protein Ku n=1 Tax=Roseiarcus sp. TaxID=1969460 RepID=UPI003C68FFAA
MAPPRASWKGYLKIAEVTCPVALYAAASSSERIALHLVNRKTGNRVHRQFVDAATGKPVEREDQVKGYEVEKDEYVTLEPEEILAAVPESDKTLNVSAFIATSDVDDVYFDRPYYLGPSDRSAEEAFALIREGLRKADAAAVAQTVLFRRVRTVLIRALDTGLAATTLNYDYEVRAAKDAFADVPEIRIKGEMLELAKHIINTKRGAFDPAAFHDRYEEALAELVKAKFEGRAIEAPKPPKPQRAADLMAALRESAGLGPKGPSGPAPKKKPPARRASAETASPRRKAG